MVRKSLTVPFEISKEDLYKSNKFSLGEADFLIEESFFFDSPLEKSLGDSAGEVMKSPCFQSSPGSLDRFKMQKINSK